MSADKPDSICPALSGSKRGMLLDVARCARQKGVDPLSHFTVGAALLSHSGRVFSGCNVGLQAGYGVCAEGVAVADAITQGEHLREGWNFLRAMAVSTEIIVDSDNPESVADGSPCGICRQVMHDFCSPAGRLGRAEIVLDDGESGISRPLSSLLPSGFRLRIHEPKEGAVAADSEALEAEALRDPAPETLLRVAREVSVNAAAHTRGQPEGAVILTRDGRAFCGVSVENSNSSHYIRALHVAINRAVVHGVLVACGDQMDFVTAIALYAPHQPSRQTAVDPVLAGQFFAEGVQVAVECGQGVVEVG